MIRRAAERRARPLGKVSVAIVEQLPTLTSLSGKRPPFSRRPSSSNHGQLLAAALFLFPSLAVLAVFHFFPLLYAFYISLHKWRFVDQGYVGLQNYQTALASTAFWSALANTCFFVVMIVPSTMLLALVFSVMLFSKVRFLSVYRTIYFLPYITSSVAAAGVWAWIFNPRYGIANWMLGSVGIGPQGWLQEPRGILSLAASRLGFGLPGWAHGPSLALVAIAIMTVWSYLGFEIVIFLVGLGNISGEVYEAARVDGAGPFQMFRRISLPLLSPSLVFVSIITTIGAFQEFNRIYQMSTQANVGSRPGGPLSSTQTLVVLVYDEFYSSLHVGYGAAIAFILFVILLGLGLVQFGFARGRVRGMRTTARIPGTGGPA